MHRWLEGKGGSDREKVVAGFQKRLWEMAKAGDRDYNKLGVALSLIWRDLAAEVGSLQGYADAPRETQKKLLVRLIDYELSCREKGNTAESVGAELLSYLLAMVAAHDADGEDMMAGPLEELARIGDPQAVIVRPSAQAATK